MAEVDYWSATKQAFAPLQLDEPEFTDKHLKRPPFRFIFDIVASINKRFAAYNHIFTLDELDYNMIDTKEKKVDYLKKLIKYIEKLLSVKIDVSPKKIVSGHECEKTNIFLQYLAMAVGYAQQDKQRRMSEPSPTAEATAAKIVGASTGTAAEDNVVKARGSVTFANPADYGFDKLPKRESLPRKKSASSRASSVSGDATANAFATVKKNLLKEVETFNQLLAGYQLSLDVETEIDIQSQGNSIVKMWNEMKDTSERTTNPTNMPLEALETAIKRQIDNLKQIHALMGRNEEVIEHLEQVLS